MTPSIFALLLAATMVGPGGTPIPQTVVVNMYQNKADCEIDKALMMKELDKQVKAEEVTRYGAICAEVKLDTVPLKKKEAKQ